MTTKTLWTTAVLLIQISSAAAEEGERLLYRRVSRFNTILVTENESGLRTLCFGDRTLRQSAARVSDPDHIEVPYVKVMTTALAVVPRPESMLFIGLGGGTLPGFLHRHCPTAKIDVVEIDADVLAVAREFFAFRENPRMRVLIQDGRQFIEASDHRYDLIFLDAYGADRIPYRLATREFLQAVRQVVTDQGVVVANVIGSKRNSLYGAMVRTYEEVFDDVCILNVHDSNNRIILAFPRKRHFRGIDLARNARVVSREKGLRFDIADFVLNGFHRPGEETKHARVLVDGDAPDGED